MAIHYVEPPEELIDAFMEGPKSGVSAKQLGAVIQETGMKISRVRRKEQVLLAPLLFEEWTYDELIDMGEEADFEKEKWSGSLREDRVYKNVDRHTYDAVEYWIKRYREAYAQAIEKTGRKVLKDEDVTTDVEGVMTGRYRKIANSDQAYKIREPLDYYYTVTPLPRDFSGIHPHVAEERVDRLWIGHEKWLITFAPYFEQVRTLKNEQDNMTPRRKVTILLNAMFGCLELHQQGYAHYDAKWDNIFLAHETDKGKVHTLLGDLEGSIPLSIKTSNVIMSDHIRPRSFYYELKKLHNENDDTFAFAVGILTMCTNKYMADFVSNRYDDSQSTYTRAAVDAFFDKLTEEEMPKKVQDVMRKILRWEDDIPTLHELCMAVATEYKIPFRRDEKGRYMTLFQN